MISYKKSGVDIDAGNEFVRRIKKTSREKFASYFKKFGNIPDFAGVFPVKELKDSYLIGTTDGVGTKLLIARESNHYRDIGIDLVAMSVNDLLPLNARPLFFLDYIACGKLSLKSGEQIINSIIRGCEMSDCILLGGETAEMPGMYQRGDYDLAGFCVGIVNKKEIFAKKNVRVDDVVVGIESNGFHSNGYSLVRKILEVNKIKYNHKYPGTNKKWFEILLKPTHIYHKLFQKLRTKINIKSCAHITGGGFYDNIIRVIPDNFRVEIYKDSWKIKDEIKMVCSLGRLDFYEQYKVFNMGIGLVLIIEKTKVDTFLNLCTDNGFRGYKLGGVSKIKNKSDQRVVFI